MPRCIFKNCIYHNSANVSRNKQSVRFYRSEDKITILPFYGGAKGQSLQIIEKPDGSVQTNIIKTPEGNEDINLQNINPTELENPSLPTKYDTENFAQNLRKLERISLRIIKLEEILKNGGRLSPSQEAAYKQDLEILSESAQQLAAIHENINPISIENREGISAWLENRKSTTNKNKTKKKEEEQKKKEDEQKRKAQEEVKRKEEAKRKQEELEEQRKKIEKQKEGESEKEENNKGEKEEGEGDTETVGIDLPPDDASVAEAKPVGLAIAGVGGVAASKPIATAVVGPGGLAIARPVGTAIAGVDPEQALIPIHAADYVLGSKPPKSGTSEKANEYLSRLVNKFHQN